MKKKLIVLLGANGSGKSTTSKALNWTLSNNPEKITPHKKENFHYTFCGDNVVNLGKFSFDLPSSGVDSSSLKGVDIYDSLLELSKTKAEYIIVEGITLSNQLFDWVLKDMEGLYEPIFMFFDLPLCVSFERIKNRRKQRGKYVPLSDKTIGHVISKKKYARGVFENVQKKNLNFVTCLRQTEEEPVEIIVEKILNNFS
jgi:thymidylate kinase